MSSFLIFLPESSFVFLSVHLSCYKGFTPFFAQALDVLAGLSKDQVDINFLLFSLFCKLFTITTVFQSYLVVAGHTGVGVYPESSKQSNIHLSITQVPELQEVDCNWEQFLGDEFSHLQISSTPVILGAALPITDVITALRAAAEAAPEEYGWVEIYKSASFYRPIYIIQSSFSFMPDCRYCQQLAHHMELVGSRGVRDVGTIGGNLMLRHQVNIWWHFLVFNLFCRCPQHPDFPSDLLALLAAVEATFEVVWKEEGRERTSNHLPSDWLTNSMDRKLLRRILLPSLPSTTKLFTHKVIQLGHLMHIPCLYQVALRSSGAHAYVSCAALLPLEVCFFTFQPHFIPPKNLVQGTSITSMPSICFTGLGAELVHSAR